MTAHGLSQRRACGLLDMDRTSFRYRSTRGDDAELRAAYAVAPWPVLSRLLSLKTDGGTGSVEQMLIAEYFGKHFDSHVNALTGVLNDKLATMVEAVEKLGIEATVDSVADPDGIVAYRIMRTPALVINERVVLQGRVPSVEDLEELFAEELQKAVPAR